MNNFIETLKNLSLGRLVALASVVVFLLGLFVYLATRGSSVEYAVLYTDLELLDAKQITEHLDSTGVEYKTAKNGAEILVPKTQLNHLRINTAEFALNSSGANVGYEIFDSADSLGSTSFVQNVNLVRALEGELSRTIRSMSNIKSARVHLVLPKREMFSKQEQEPSASVVIKTKHGSLSTAEIQSVQKLIAAAVPKLDVKNVAIVDANGKLLTNNYDDPEAMNTLNNDVVKINQEKKIANNLQSLLEKTLGVGKVRATVNLDMDFDQVVINEELYDPDTQVVRSQASVTEEGVNGYPQGVVSVSQNIPNADVVSASNSQYSQNSRTEETTNYEISKVTTNKVRTSGVVTRVSVAVLVDGFYSKDSSGEFVYNPRTQDELESISALVKSAVGYDPNRGDLIEVKNLRFAPNDIIAEQSFKEPVIALGLTKTEFLKISENLGVALVAILVIMLVIKPLINTAFAPSTAQQLIGDSSLDSENLLLSNFLNDDDSSMDEMISMQNFEGRVKVSSLKRINDLVEKNPDDSINIIRSWLYSSKES